jgi:hypothetical protein
MLEGLGLHKYIFKKEFAMAKKDTNVKDKAKDKAKAKDKGKDKDKKKKKK